MDRHLKDNPLMALTPEARKELLLSIEENQLLDELFNHSGMRPLLEKVKEMHDEYSSLKNVKSMEDLHFKRGQLDILSWLLSYQDMIRHTLENQVVTAESEVRLLKMQKGVIDD